MMKHVYKLLVPLLLLTACGTEDPVPKPRGYFRIDLPPREYVSWQDEGVLSAELPTYARIQPRTAEGSTRWYDLRFPAQRATLHLTWTPVTAGSVMDLVEDAHVFKNTHESKAVRIASARVLRDSARVFGSVFHVDGDVASPLVFYLTDSTANFLYGALYFDVRPNADSLAPVTQRIREDVEHFTRTLEWQ
jgi:gliding motility-associated lipoprotein GldD